VHLILSFTHFSSPQTGYGDYTPQSQIDKLYCVFFFPFSVAVFGEVLGRIASIYIQRRTREAETKHLQRALTRCDLRNMDADEDGMVSREEWMMFMLVMLQKVDRESIDQLKDIFHSMDRNGNGYIDKEDLVHLQETPQWESIREVAAEVDQ
jgi:Ca2+-binding EF-hand superfamily protein